jgi:peptidyl-tRNA hydrolase, PTH1 family
MIRLIAGLGNPGTRYEGTRHNLGFRTVDRLLELSPAKSERLIHHALIFETEQFGLLCKPLSYMNRSGVPLKVIAQEFGIQPNETLVIYDDFALELGLIRVRQRGSSGGHNGLESIIQQLGTTEVPRIRMGIKTDEMDQWVDFVLGSFKKSELKTVNEMIENCAEAVQTILEKGISTAMNKFNKKQNTEIR